MDFSLNEEQELLKNSLERFLADEYPIEKRRKISASEAGWSEEVWGALAELGLLAAPFSEDDGGLGGGPVEIMVAQEAFGAALLVEPFVPTVVAGGGFLRRASAEMRAAALPGVIDGSLRLAFAQAERGARYDLNRIATRAEKSGGGYALTGAKTAVIAGGIAQKLIVSARTAGGEADRDGITLFLVDADARGVTRRSYPTYDGLTAAEIAFDGVSVGADAVIGEVDGGAPIMAAVVDETLAALCAEATGVMKRLHAMTLEYARERKQFGRPIASFQVIAHRLSEMYVRLEEATSLTVMATGMLAADDATRARHVAAAKAGIGKAATLLAEDSVQIYGGMGVTNEMDSSLYFKRLTALEKTFGDTAHHLRRFAKAA